MLGVFFDKCKSKICKNNAHPYRNKKKIIRYGFS